MISLPGGRRYHVAQGELKDALTAWIKEASGAERFARHEHAVKHKEYIMGGFMGIAVGLRGLRKLAGSPFRAKYRPKETCPVCLLVEDQAAWESARFLRDLEIAREAQLEAGREAAESTGFTRSQGQPTAAEITTQVAQEEEKKAEEEEAR